MGRIEDLEKQIHEHNINYFIKNEPKITDEEFDKLTEELKSLKPNSPVLFELVGDIGNIEHPTPMLSLDKKYTHADIIKWLEDINDKEYLVEPKYDGMAARYQNGTLSTRGDGTRGEDISIRLPFLNIKGKLPTNPNTSAYGEIIIPLSYFNEHLANDYKNPRNAVVGIVKAKTISPSGIKTLNDGGVHFVLHDQAQVIKVTQNDLIDEDRWEEILEEMFRIDYPLDGIVIKATNPDIIRSLGRTQHHEKWEIAYKSPAERKITTVKEIKDQVGRTGRITSVAVIDPINLSGATVTNVTLHNFQFVLDSGIDIGSKVEVCRSGEVIPFITRVFPADKPQNKRTYLLPENCPICNTKLIEKGKYLECPNRDCPAQKIQSIEYFFKTLDVEELGNKTIVRFINEFKVSSILDFYELDKEKIAELDGFGEKSAENITRNIKKTLDGTITESQMLQALGIKAIGPAASKWIINHYGFSKLPSLRADDLKDVKGIGPIKAQHFVDDLKVKWPIVESLLKKGLKFKSSKKSNKLDGKSFAITGKKEKYSRDELIQMIEENGGVYKTSITKDLDYLIAGEDAGSKLEKANQLGVKVITETEFCNLI